MAEGSVQIVGALPQCSAGLPASQSPGNSNWQLGLGKLCNLPAVDCTSLGGDDDRPYRGRGTVQKGVGNAVDGVSGVAGGARQEQKQLGTSWVHNC